MLYQLKSSKNDIINKIIENGFFLGDNANIAANIILNYCPPVIYKNIDEIVQNNRLSKIPFILSTPEKRIKISLHEIYFDFQEQFPPIMILYAICKEIKDSDGLLWLYSYTI